MPSAWHEMGIMDRKFTMVLACLAVVGFFTGGFVGQGIFYSTIPGPPAPSTYTLTIIDYKTAYVNDWLNWTPANAGVNYTDGSSKQCVRIVFEEDTMVRLVTPNGGFNPWFGPDAAEVVWVNLHLSFIKMNGSKTVQVQWD
jgi:hypothetical protein